MNDKILDYVSLLFGEYGWYSLLLVAFTFVIMLGVNALLVKIFSKAEKDGVKRLRKTLAQLSVYLIGAGVIAVSNLIFKIDFDINYILVNCIPVGSLAMVLWAIVKVVRDCGFKTLLNKIATSKAVKKLLKKIPLNSTTTNAVFDRLVELINEGKGDNAEIVATKEKELTDIAIGLLNNFVEAENIANVATQFVDAVKVKFNK